MCKSIQLMKKVQLSSALQMPLILQLKTQQVLVYEFTLGQILYSLQQWGNE